MTVAVIGGVVFRLPRMEDHVTLINNWSRRRKACTCKLLKRIRGEIYTKLQTSLRVRGGTS